jgi:GxxExxY protein
MTDATPAAAPRNRSNLLHGELTEVVLGGFYAVHSQLGVGFLEGVYRNALTVILRGAGVVVAREVPYEIIFQGCVIGHYRADLVVGDRVVVEVKAANNIHEMHCDQLRNYLRVSNLQVGLLLNFGKSAQFRRIISTTRG